jgi:hypothetical protein
VGLKSRYFSVMKTPSRKKEIEGYKPMDQVTSSNYYGRRMKIPVYRLTSLASIEVTKVETLGYVLKSHTCQWRVE